MAKSSKKIDLGDNREAMLYDENVLVTNCPPTGFQCNFTFTYEELLTILKAAYYDVETYEDGG